MSDASPLTPDLKTEASRLWRARRLVLAARVAIAHQDDPRAVDALAEATRLNPEDEELRRVVKQSLAPGVRTFNQWPTAYALKAFLTVLAVDPANGDAHLGLGDMALRQRRFDVALEQNRLAVRYLPGSALAMNNLAWILAVHPDPACRNPAEAVQLAEKAAELTSRQDVNTLDTLAAAYAAAGRFAEAQAAAEQALTLLGDNAENAEGMRSRLDLYKAGRPYVLEAGP
jgi:spermidine synthase